MAPFRIFSLFLHGDAKFLPIYFAVKYFFATFAAEFACC